MKDKIKIPYTRLQYTKLVDYCHSNNCHLETQGDYLIAIPNKNIPLSDDDINMLTMTALDFINLVRTLGLTPEEIKEYLDANIELDMQLKYCQNVYCGVVRRLCPLKIQGLTISDEMVVKAFKDKNNVE